MASDFSDPYGSDVLNNDPHREGSNTIRPRLARMHLEVGMVLEDVASSRVGAAVRVEKSGGVYLVELENHRGRARSFPLGMGFRLEGRPIIALPPRPTPMEQVKNVSGLTTMRGWALTNSGSIAAPKSTVRVARASRIWVEGHHDAGLVQHVQGDDLAEAGVVVRPLEGVDKFEEVFEVFGPNDRVRAGVLVDHLVLGPKEPRVTETVVRRWRKGVPVLGHPYVDIWQAVKPSRPSLEAWPQIERGIDIKHGTLEALGWPHENQVDITMGWKRVLSRTHNYKNLEPALLGRVEELIDFVTAPGLP